MWVGVCGSGWRRLGGWSWLQVSQVVLGVQSTHLKAGARQLGGSLLSGHRALIIGLVRIWTLASSEHKMRHREREQQGRVLMR